MNEIIPLDGLTTTLINNRKALLIGSGVVVALVTGYFVLVKHKKQNSNTPVNRPEPVLPDPQKNSATLTI